MSGLTRRTENSHIRHVQYCRRRTLSNRISRPRACKSCSKSKSKCDHKLPCSRCVKRHGICEYDAKFTGVPTPILDCGAALSNFAEAASPMPQDDDRLISPSLAMFTTDDLSNELDTYTAPVADKTDTFLSLLTSSIDEESSTSLQHLDQGLMQMGLSTSFLPFKSSLCLYQPAALIALEPSDADGLIRCHADMPGGMFAEGCLRLISTFITSYPRMMTTVDTLPPFVHPLGCGLHFDGRVEGDIIESMAFAPLEPLEASMGIAQVFSSRTENTDSFLRRSVESEHHRHIVKVSIGSSLCRCYGPVLDSLQLFNRWNSSLRARGWRPCKPCWYISSFSLPLGAAARSPVTSASTEP